MWSAIMRIKNFFKDYIVKTYKPMFRLKLPVYMLTDGHMI